MLLQPVLNNTMSRVWSAIPALLATAFWIVRRTKIRSTLPPSCASCPCSLKKREPETTNGKSRPHNQAPKMKFFFDFKEEFN